MAQMLGDDTTDKILGKKEVKEKKIQIPVIPTIKTDAKDTSYYDNKMSQIYLQGSKYNQLPNDKKRKYRISYLRQLFEVTRNAEAKNEDILKYLNVLEQGGSREGVYRSIVLDQVYLALEGYDESPSEKLVAFIHQFALRFLGIKYDQENIRQFNLYGLKRIITEKSLEILEAFAQKSPNDLYSWYAVLSTELAKEYPSLWQTEVRKKTIDLYHYKWSQTVPFQHIKSELIIKLHKVMNFLGQN